MLKRISSSLSATIKNSSVLLAALSLAFLAGCAAPKAQQSSGPVFFPPAPNPPRLQYLMAINGSTDIDAKKDTFSLFLTGAPEQDKVLEIFKPYGVTVHKKKIYVCDLAGKVVVIDPAKKTFVYFKGSGYGGIKKPLNLTFDEDDNMFVVDIERREILVYNASGVFVTAIGKEHGIKPVDVIVDKENIYVLDMAGNEIKVFSKEDGTLLRSLGKSEDTQHLAIPTNFAIDKQGAFRITNVGKYNVVQIDKDGHLLSTFGKLGDGFGDFARPKGIAVDKEGNIFVVDAAHQNVQVFGDSGRLLMFFGGVGNSDGLMNLPASVAVANADMEFFEKFVDPSFQMESLVFVTNQFGKSRLSVYALGKSKAAPALSKKGAGDEKERAESAETRKSEPAATGK